MGRHMPRIHHICEPLNSAPNYTLSILFATFKCVQYSSASLEFIMAIFIYGLVICLNFIVFSVHRAMCHRPLDHFFECRISSSTSHGTHARTENAVTVWLERENKPLRFCAGKTATIFSTFHVFTCKPMLAQAHFFLRRRASPMAKKNALGAF